MEKTTSTLETRITALENEIKGLKRYVNHLMAFENGRQKHITRTVLAKAQAELTAEETSKEV